MKIRPMGDKLSHADGGTESHDEANSCLPQVCECTWKCLQIPCCVWL